jgi:chlorosome envelope protein B
MANETNIDLSAALNNLLNTATTLVQQVVELAISGIKTAVGAIEPLGKAAGDLVGSTTAALGQAVQNVTSAIAPKK